MLNFIDFEVFKFDWLMVGVNLENKKTDVIINDREKLLEYYNNHKDEIFIGYNIRNYDQYIFKGILCGFNPKEINDWIIIKEKDGWRYSNLLSRNYPMIIFDCLYAFHSLKTLEGFMGCSIKETDVDFNVDRKLTEEEIAETVNYCSYDVEKTIDVFIERKSEFDAQLALIKMFKLPITDIGKTQAQLAAIILEAKPKTFNDDEWDIRLPETLNLHQYRKVAEWFLDRANHDYSKKFECEIAGVKHVIGWGGIHGALEKFHYICKKDELLIMADVNQLYPTLMVQYNLLSRAATNAERFKFILNESLRLKKEGKKKEREPFKRICNITYGAEGDELNPMFDPLHRNLVCVFGQTLLVDLIEKIEQAKAGKLIQSNTDGILLLVKRKDFDLLDDTVYKWEQRTGLMMAFDYYNRIIQKDVNNYILIDDEGNYKSKGAYVKKLSKLDNDLPIVNRALVAYMKDKIPVENTIEKADDLILFQKIVKVSSKYLCAYHNGKRLKDKTFRIFASTDWTDSFIGKQNKKRKTIEKFANTPEHCFIINSDITGAKIPKKLDKSYYVDLAKKRLKDFGFDEVV